MVSGNPANRPPVRDRQKKISQPAKAVGLAIISANESGMLFCSCGGFSALDVRKKVREDRAQKHIDKKHNGRGVWL